MFHRIREALRLYDHYPVRIVSRIFPLSFANNELALIRTRGNAYRRRDTPTRLVLASLNEASERTTHRSMRLPITDDGLNFYGAQLPGSPMLKPRERHRNQ
jgi:hypothetical protein